MKSLPTEILFLALSVVLGFVQILAASHSASWQRGYRWAASSRDEPVPPLSGVAGRLARSLDNFSETFPMFAALVLAVVVTGRTGTLSAWGAGLYFAARVVYVVLYALGVPLLRSLVWNVAAAGIFMLAAALLGLGS